MSGIAGVHYLDDRPVAPGILERMGASLAHRGPDGSATWRRHSIGFAHRMLWTTPESLAEKLPCESADGELALTADARIDNREELIGLLGVTDRAPFEVSDSELILAAYARWGEACPEKLLGDFAFALWDGRRKRLFCARDTAGVKPFYYYHQPGKLFAFASEIKALFCVPEVPRQLNELRVAYHIIGLFEDATITYYRDVLRLPAAHCIHLMAGGVRCRSYWSLDPSRELRLGSDEEYAEAFREVFTRAVRCRLRSAFPLGSTLSGGLDSSSIACTARDALASEGGGPLKTFSAIFPGLPKEDLPKIDERACIEAVVTTGGFEPFYLRADQLSPLAELDRVLWHQDEALYGPNLYLHWALRQLAHQQGVRIMLDGNDGDTTVSHGWTRLTELAWTGRWRALSAELTATARRWRLSRRTLVLRYCLQPLAMEPARQLWWGLRRRPLDLRGTGINPSFAHRLDLVERVRSVLSRGPEQALRARQAHWRGMTSPAWPYALELADKAAAACRVENRYPFFDRRLMEFCLALPSAQKFSQGWTRIILRRAMRGTLPDRIRWRVRKATLAPNFQRNLLGRDRPTLEQIIWQEPEGIAEFVDLSSLQEAYRRYAANPLESEADVNRVYRAVLLGHWLCSGAGFPARCTGRHCMDLRKEERYAQSMV